jgi:hypothetical protein
MIQKIQRFTKNHKLTEKNCELVNQNHGIKGNTVFFFTVEKIENENKNSNTWSSTKKSSIFNSILEDLEIE